jgi:hypothetical protein
MADVVTALQDEASALGTMLYDFIGTLQRDAPPASVAGEPIVGAGTAGALDEHSTNPNEIRDVPAAAAQMAEQLMASFRRAHALVDRLPEGAGGGGASSSDQRIAALLAERRAADAELRAAAADGERALRALHALDARCAEGAVRAAADAEAARVRLPEALTGAEDGARGQRRRRR